MRNANYISEDFFFIAAYTAFFFRTNFQYLSRLSEQLYLSDFLTPARQQSRRRRRRPTGSSGRRKARRGR